MRAVVLTVVQILIVVLNASAALVSFDVTGERAERIDVSNNYFGGAALGPTGGPAANNSLGYAFQFRLDQSTYLRNIVSDIELVSFTSMNNFVDFDYIVYGETTENSRFPGDPIPDIQSVLGRGSVYLSNSADHNIKYSDTASEDLNLNLGPGTYWLAYERDYGYSMSQGLVSNIRYDNQAVAPEPGTWSLLGMGLLGALKYRKRVLPTV